MPDFLFVSQEMLDNWMMQGKIDFSGNEMTIHGDSRRYVLEPAVRFVRVVGDEPDAAGLLAKVKTLDQLKEVGAEHYMDSVLLGDTAYDVQNGFVARVDLGGAGAAPESARAPGVETPVRVPEGVVRPQARPEPPSAPSRARTEPATPAVTAEAAAASPVPPAAAQSPAPPAAAQNSAPQAAAARSPAPEPQGPRTPAAEPGAAAAPAAGAPGPSPAPEPDPGAAAPPSANSLSEALEGERSEDSDQELLARFLLDNLR